MDPSPSFPLLASVGGLEVSFASGGRLFSDVWVMVPFAEVVEVFPGVVTLFFEVVTLFPGVGSWLLGVAGVLFDGKG